MYYKYLLWIAACLSLSISASYSQETSTPPDGEGKALTIRSPLQWSVYVVGGAGYRLPTGSGVSAFKDEVGNFMLEGEDILNSSTSAGGMVAPFIGVRAGVLQAGNIEGGFGLQYTRQGYDLEAAIQLSDPEYQRDDVFTYQTEVRGAAIELPLWARYEWKPGIYLGGGFIAGFPLRGSMEATTTLSYDVYLNGVVDEEYSIPQETETIDLKDDTKGFYPGLFAEAAYTLPYSIIAGFMVQYTGAAVSYPEGNVSSISAVVSLSYKIR